MTSPAFWLQSVSAVFYPAVFLHNSRALNSIARYEKNEQVHQADLFKGQTLAFIFQQKFHIHLSIYPICQVNTREWTAAIVALVVTRQNSMAAKSFLLNNTFSILSKIFFTPNMYCRSSKILVTLYRMHFWLNCVGAKLFSPKKTNDRTPSLRDAFNGNVTICNVHNWRHSDVNVIKLTAFTKE